MTGAQIGAKAGAKAGETAVVPTESSSDLDRATRARRPGRPTGWERAAGWVGPAVVVACCVAILWQLQPALLLKNTTANGGDMGAHVWFPAYLRDHLLPHLRIAGWAPAWYAGFPAGQFYFPLPALAIVALNTIMPYNIAFKLVSAAGSVAMPLGAYLCARGLALRRPAPALFAVAALVFEFFKGIPGTSARVNTTVFNQRIMGGPMASTLAGEFSFAIALCLGLMFLGALARALREDRGLAVAAVLLAATVLSHIVVAIFVAVGAVVIWLFHRPRHGLPVAVAVGVVGALITAVWSVPLVATFGYTSSMRYEKLTWYRAYLFPHSFWWIFALAIVGVVAAALQRNRGALALVVLTALFGGLFVVWPELGAWNLRLLPFWYIGLYLVAAFGAAAIVEAVGIAAPWVLLRPVDAPGEIEDLNATPPDETEDAEASAPPHAPPVAARTVTGSDIASGAETERRGVRAPNEDSALGVNGVTDTLPELGGDAFRSSGEDRLARVMNVAVVAILVIGLSVAALVQTHRTRTYLDFWVQWNYSGYQDTNPHHTKPKAWPEYHRLMETMGSLPPGRATWEGGPALDAYGTPLSLELLPYWTHGRIDSMEGLYFESSATTPYHFLTVAKLSGPGNASNPVRGLDYEDISEFHAGVRQLRALGVRYYMAYSDEAKNAADADPDLTLVATVPDLDGQAPKGWKIYQVKDAPLVAAMPEAPVVVPMKAGTQSQCFGRAQAPGQSNPRLGAWECTSARWWEDIGTLGRPLATDGPSSWTRAKSRADAALTAPRTLPVVHVSRIRTSDDVVSFHVDRVGVPVLVKVSYFPNWRAYGAHGPYRVTPNFMVVVPTSHDVRLTYARTVWEWTGFALTIVGFGGLAALAFWWPRGPGKRRRTATRGADEPEGDGARVPDAVPDAGAHRPEGRTPAALP